MPLLNSTKTFFEEILDQFGLFLAATFGLMVALAWNDAIRKETTQNENGPRMSPWAFAGIVTVIAVVLMALWATFVASRLYPVPRGLDMEHMVKTRSKMPEIPEIPEIP